ncbi:MAG: bifunctional UDP-N-acetylglucosamine diphosphorylase/glucosamine-1-phosphate N-acetyltransferase GlmU [Syntrophomonadaceae bacterium]|nr:bifunctional UDP-N-acetylglucosamine diphosphorylase/glucosamine-1-phosphate N-acetyltransferase GlmU [Syntrophomonadaceae bacterium]
MVNAAVILAAGKGVRMRSAYPKVVHKVSGRPMIQHVVHAVQAAGITEIYVVVGHGREHVIESLSGFEVEFIVQEQQLGTGHALKQAESGIKNHVDRVLVLSGDTPLIRSSTLTSLLAWHIENNAAATVLSARVDDPAGYGRIIRNEDQSLYRIIEEKDARPEQKAIKEINAGIYCFNRSEVFPRLSALTTNNAQGEYYLTDVLSLMIDDGLKVGVVVCEDSNDVLGINDRVQLAYCEALMRRRKNVELMKAGVTIIAPETVFIDQGVEIGADTIIRPNTIIEGHTVIGEECDIGPWARITNTVVGKKVSIEAARIIDAHIGDECTIGPFSYLRPGTRLAKGVKVGDFVEIKNSNIGEYSKIPHLSYVGDAQVGIKVNIGAGTITCNYDGVNKYPTFLEDGVFIGSNTNLVAPVRIGRNSVTGAGSTITRDVPPDSLAVERAQQRNIKGWYRKSKDDQEVT